MSRLTSCVVLPLALGVAVGAFAQDNDWLAGARAREFRMRVAQLAVIYGDSRGIDPRGLLVTGQRVDEVQAGCADVEIVVLAKQQELLRERVRACRHAAGVSPIPATSAPRPPA